MIIRTISVKRKIENKHMVTEICANQLSERIVKTETKYEENESVVKQHKSKDQHIFEERQRLADEQIVKQYFF
jgi:hypothetical protein